MRSGADKFNLASDRDLGYVPHVPSAVELFNQELLQAQRRAFVDLVARHPRAFIDELADLARAQYPHLLDIRAGELVAGLGATGEAARNQDGSVNTRTAAGRQALDAAVLAYLNGCDELVTGADVRNVVGGSAAQVRQSLNRLIEAELVGWEGKGRGTRYGVA